MKNHLKLNKFVLITLLISFSCTIFGMQDANDQFLRAVLDGNVAGIKQALDYGVNADATFYFQHRYRFAVPDTALRFSVGAGRTDIVKLLLEKGANVDATNEYGKTALMFAIALDRTDLIKILLENGANINARDSNGDTVLMLASSYGCSSDIVKLLLERGADINAIHHGGQTALTITTQSPTFLHSIDIIDLLEEEMHQSSVSTTPVTK
jgi:ankyrin repeat protein